MSDLTTPVRLTPAQVRQRVAAIRQRQTDPEAAHILEDELYTEVLSAIAAGDEQAVELAREALLTRSLKHERWVA